MRCGQAASSVVQLLLLTCTACLTSFPVAGNPGGEARAGRDYGMGGLCNELHEQAPWPALVTAHTRFVRKEDRSRKVANRGRKCPNAFLTGRLAERGQEVETGKVSQCMLDMKEE